MPSESVTKFIIVSQGRTGSNFLVSLLNQYPQICCQGELFHPTKVWTLADLDDDMPEARKAEYESIIVPTEVRDADPETYLNRVWEIDRQQPSITCVGVKLHHAHTRKMHEILLHNKEYIVVILDREDKLAQFASLKIAMQSGKWRHVKGQKENKNQVKVRFSLFWFLSYCFGSKGPFEYYRRRLERHHRHYLDVTYEMLTQGAGVRLVLDYLGVQYDSRFTSPLKRQNIEDTLSRYSNPGWARFGNKIWLLLDWLQFWRLYPESVQRVLRKLRGAVERRFSASA